MNIDIKHLLLMLSAVLGLFTAQLAQSRDYVPPPSGPYQSSVVINDSVSESGQQQVYKFPPPDILIEDSHERADFLSEPSPQYTEPQRPASVRNDANLSQPQVSAPDPQIQLPPDNYYQWQAPLNDSYKAMPGWNGYQGVGPSYNQNVWQQAPQYGYPQQSPYSYGRPDQYNGANNPFYGMPSPWNVMPKNPFFSDN